MPFGVHCHSFARLLADNLYSALPCKSCTCSYCTILVCRPATPLGSSSPVRFFHNSKYNWLNQSVVLHSTRVIKEVQLSFCHSPKCVNCYWAFSWPLFSGSSESSTVFRKLHFEGVEQFLVSAYDHPGFTSRQQDAKHTGSEQCEFDLQTDLLSISCLSQFSHGSCGFANSVLYIFHVVIIPYDYAAQIHKFVNVFNFHLAKL